MFGQMEQNIRMGFALNGIFFQFHLHKTEALFKVNEIIHFFYVLICYVVLVYIHVGVWVQHATVHIASDNHLSC